MLPRKRSAATPGDGTQEDVSQRDAGRYHKSIGVKGEQESGERYAFYHATVAKADRGGRIIQSRDTNTYKVSRSPPSGHHPVAAYSNASTLICWRTVPSGASSDFNDQSIRQKRQGSASA